MFAPWRLATAIYKAKSIGAVALIVIEVLTFSKGISLNNISISDKLDIGTPDFPTSPSDMGWSES